MIGRNRLFDRKICKFQFILFASTAFITLFVSVSLAGQQSEDIRSIIDPSGYSLRYDIGSASVTDVWVDPAKGNDQNNGTTRAQALRTVTAAWERISIKRPLATKGFRLQLVAGTYPAAAVPAYWESRYGTFRCPVIIQSADGAGTAVLPGMNIFDCRYLYLIGLKLTAGGGDVLHFERCDHVLVRDGLVVGTGDIMNNQGPQEALKANQCQYVYIENSDISGGWDNAVDFVAVQYGHIVASRVHRAQEWCLYLKGGSGYFRVEANELFDGGTGGFSAGQGSGLEWMVSPWIHYEAHNIKFVNNVVHDTTGAGMGVNGGYNILLAYNTLYRVGSRSHVVEVVQGNRRCDGDTTGCRARLNEGGWGTTDGEGGQWIPNHNVFIYDNIIYNPPGFRSEWQHFTIAGPANPPSGSNVPSPSLADANLQIRGNFIWNGPRDLPLGVGDGAGCPPSNSTCNERQILAENTINNMEPQLVDPAKGDFRPLPAGNVFSVITFDLRDFLGNDRPQRPLAPQGDLKNVVAHDRDGNARTSKSPPGAYVGR